MDQREAANRQVMWMAHGTAWLIIALYHGDHVIVMRQWKGYIGQEAPLGQFKRNEDGSFPKGALRGMLRDEPVSEPLPYQEAAPSAELPLRFHSALEDHRWRVAMGGDW